MIKGLVIGKFLPIHKGHVALIRFAATQCDELIVSMSHSPSDPIDGRIRFAWIEELFRDDPKIKPRIIVDDFDPESADWPQRTKAWAIKMREVYGKIDKLFSSEPYGEYFAENLGASNVIFDVERKRVPVSASMIRRSPFVYWDFIPEVVRPYFVKKVCFYGPESTGKSTMAEQMAKIFQTEWVPEVSRELITSNDFTVDDIIRIGYAQTERVIEKTKTANKILFCDTDLITTQIYSRHYLGVVPDILFELEKRIQYDQYFLFDIDVPWIDDGLRGLGDRRKEMMEVFRGELDRRGIRYQFVTGNFEVRQEKLLRVLQKC